MNPTISPEAIRNARLTPAAGTHVHQELRAYFDSGATRTVRQRLRVLRALRDAIKRYEDDLTEALTADLRKPPFETYTSEIGFCYQDIDHTLAHLESWAKVRPVHVGMAVWPSRGEVHPVPKGVALVIAPWNYPVNLALAPLIAALAAGCCAVLKPAEETPHTALVLERIVRAACDYNHVRVVQGPGAQVVPALMDAGRFDHVFYTGSTRVGRELGERCGRELIPCTLELGGKSPAIVFADAALGSTTERLAWGKCFNLGQTCVAPDYVLVQRPVYDAFLEQLRTALVKAYGEHPQESPDLARIINDHHFERLHKLLGEGTVVHGGQTDAAERFIAPTILTDVPADAALLTEEIFGPLLPVIPFDTWAEARAIVQRNPDPLAAYAFTQSEEQAARFIDELSFGGGCINDVIMHLSVADLPFGGVHASGHGRYHGEEGFRTFSNLKSIVRSPGRINIPTKYAPYNGLMLRAVRWILG